MTGEQWIYVYRMLMAEFRVWLRLRIGGFAENLPGMENNAIEVHLS